MPNKKITAMPSLAGNQVPTDLVTAVDLSAAPVNQNVKSTLNDLFAVITKNITDRAMRFQAPGSAPAVAAASQGALYHDGTAFLASSNGGAYEPLYTLSAQSAALVFAGPTSGPAATPTFRALALTDLPTLATASLVGRSSAGTGTPEQISSTAALLTWLTNPTSSNLLAAMTDETGAGLLVFNQSPVLVTPNIATIRASNNQDVLNLIGQTGPGGRNFFQMTSGLLPNGPTLEAFNSTQADIDLIIRAKGNGSVRITGAAVQAIGPGTNPGIVEARGGNQLGGGGKIYLYERSNNGTNYVGFEAPDSIASDIFWTLPDTDGTAGQVLSTNGAGILSWATRGNGTVTSVGLSAPSIFTVTNSPVTGSGTLTFSLAPQGQAQVFASPVAVGGGTPSFRFLQVIDLPQISSNSLLGRTSAGVGNTESIFSTSQVMTWLQTPTANNLRSAVTGNTGTGNLVFADGATISSPTITSGNLSFAVTGTGQKITWDGAASLFNRLTFQSGTLNTPSTPTFLPNGTGTATGINYIDRGDDPVNFNLGQFTIIKNGEMRLNCQSVMSVSPIPLNICTQAVVRMSFENNSNIGINSTNYASGVGVIAIRDAVTNPGPGIFPTGGGILYASGGALRWRGPFTDTQIAPA